MNPSPDMPKPAGGGTGGAGILFVWLPPHRLASGRVVPRRCTVFHAAGDVAALGAWAQAHGIPASAVVTHYVERPVFPRLTVAGARLRHCRRGTSPAELARLAAEWQAARIRAGAE